MSINGNKPMKLKDGKILYDDLAERIQTLPSGANIVMVQDQQPALDANKVWLTETPPAGVEVPTYGEFTGVIAPDYANLSFPVSAGEHCIHNGVLYTAIQNINASEAWTAAHWEAGSVSSKLTEISNAIQGLAVTPEMYGAKGDGVTDDSQAVQDAVDAGYNIKFDDNKTYYLANTVTIDHDIHLIGGLNTTIKTKTPTGGTVNNGIVISGTLKKTTTMTSDYSATDATVANSMNRFKFADMEGIEIGDIVVIKAEDQYYHYNRQYYYLGATLLVADKDSEYIYTADSMPWDIENTENVSVSVYDAPTAIIEDLHFESDLESVGTYHYIVMLDRCKNSVIENCEITEIDNGVRAWECVNLLVDGINISKTPARQGSSDHYGVALYACNNSVVSRVIGQCANSCVDLSGNTPNMNTYIRNCVLLGANRVDGLGLHENAYNTVVEDCVLGGMAGYGTITVQRCRFIQRNKLPESSVAITYRGGHRKEFSRLFVSDCIFEGNNLSVGILGHHPQNPIQPYDNIIDEIVIRDCVGGTFICIPQESETVLSNTINRIVFDNWQNCKEIYRTDQNTIGCFIVKDCTFERSKWINKHNDAFFADGIRFLQKINTYPQENKIFVDEIHGGQFYLKDKTKINFSSSDNEAKCLVCGNNIISNKPDDYAVGSISGSVGNEISRSVNNTFINSVSVNADGEIVFTQPSNSSGNVFIYPVCMMYVHKAGKIKASCKLKNTGNTEGATFRIYIAVIDAKTGLLTYRSNGETAQATADGAVITHSRDITGDSIVMVYLYCSTSVLSSETTFAEFVANIMPFDSIEDLTFEEYVGESITGNGTINALDGLNNIATNASTAVSVKFNADLLK